MYNIFGYLWKNINNWYKIYKCTNLCRKKPFISRFVWSYLILNIWFSQYLRCSQSSLSWIHWVFWRTRTCACVQCSGWGLSPLPPGSHRCGHPPEPVSWWSPPPDGTSETPWWSALVRSGSAGQPIVRPAHLRGQERRVIVMYIFYQVSLLMENPVKTSFWWFLAGPIALDWTTSCWGQDCPGRPSWA